MAVAASSSSFLSDFATALSGKSKVSNRIEGTGRDPRAYHSHKISQARPPIVTIGQFKIFVKYFHFKNNKRPFPEDVSLNFVVIGRYMYRSVVRA